MDDTVKTVNVVGWSAYTMKCMIKARRLALQLAKAYARRTDRPLG